MHTNVPVEVKSLADKRCLIEYYFKGIFAALCAFIILKTSIDILVSNNEICRRTVHVNSLDRNHFYIIVYSSGSSFIGFGLVCIMRVISFWKRRNALERISIYSIPLAVCAMQVSNLGVSLSIPDPIFCVSSFGLPTPSQLWAKEIISIPLIAYFTVAINSDSIRSPGLWLITIGILISTSCIFGASVVVSRFAFFGFVIAAAVGYILAVSGCFAYKMPGKSKTLLPSTFEIFVKDHTSLEWTIARTNIFIYIYIIPLYFVVFIVGNVGYLTDIQTCIAIGIIDAGLMIVYLSYISDSHIQLLESLTSYRTATNFGQSSRKEFMRYVFHELRNPLNSITLGLDLLNRNDEYGEAEAATLGVIKSSIEYINTTLADVSQMDIIEDGVNATVKRSFPLQQTFLDTVEQIYNAASSKGITIETEFSAALPVIVLGDRDRVVLVLTKFISHSVRRANPNSKIFLKVGSKPFRSHSPSASSVRQKQEHRASATASNTSRVAIDNQISDPITEASHRELDEHLRQIGEDVWDEDSELNLFRLTVQVEEEACPGYETAELESLFKPFSKLTSSGISTERPGALANGLGMALARDVTIMLGGSVDARRTSGESGVRLGFSLPLEAISYETDPNATLLFKTSEPSYEFFPTGRPPLPNKTSTSSHSNDDAKEQKLVALMSTPDTESISSTNSKPKQSPLNANIAIDFNSCSNSANITRYNTPRTDRHDEASFAYNNQLSSLEEGNAKNKDQLGLIPEDEIDNTSTHGAFKSNPTLTSTYEMKKFLLVDDVMTNNRMLGMILKNQGLTSDYVENGALAVDAIAVDIDKYEAIFMDYTMPVMDGADATAAIRQLGFNRLIIGVTGNALGDDMARFLDSGADAVIPKPLRPAQLKAVMAYIREYSSQSDGSKLVLRGNADNVVVERELRRRTSSWGTTS